MSDPLELCLLPVAGGMCALKFGHDGRCLSHSEVHDEAIRARAHAEGLEAGWSAARKLALQEITQLANNAKHDMWAHPAFVQAHEYVFRALNAEGVPRSLIPAAPEVIK